MGDSLKEILPLPEAFDASNEPCEENGRKCVRKAHCYRYANGRHSCRCNRGYRGNGYTKCEGVYTRKRKKDMDECALNRNHCDINAYCVNLDGAYKCRCKPGYVGTGFRSRCRKRGPGDPYELSPWSTISYRADPKRRERRSLQNPLKDILSSEP